MMLHKGDICLVNLEGGFGHEQVGKRPALVLAATDTRIVVVIPLFNARLIKNYGRYWDFNLQK